MQNPEDRTGFKLALPKWAKDNRKRLVGAAYAIVESWILNGRKDWTGRSPGSLEGWAKCVGGVLEHAGSREFLKNLEESRDWTEEALDELPMLVSEWWQTYAGNKVTTAQLATLRTAVESDMKAKTIGYRLKSARDQIFSVEGGHVKCEHWRSNSAKGWQLVTDEIQ